MKRGILLWLVLLRTSLAICQFPENFESYDCDRDNAAGWSFSSFSFSSMQAINGSCSARSSQLSNPAGNFFIMSPALYLGGSTTISFAYKVLNTSSNPSAQLILVEANTLNETVVWSQNINAGNTTFFANLNIVATGNYHIKWKASGSGGASRFYLDDISLATPLLPVELKRFFATSGDDGLAELVWETASEENCEGFQVEILSGADFQPLIFIPASGGGIYRTPIDLPAFRENYFRLKIIDYDGTFSYSEIIEISGKGKPGWQCLPADGNRTFELRHFENEDELKICLFDTTGKLVFEKNIEILSREKTLLTLPGDLTANLYFLKIFNHSNQLSKAVFLK